MYLGLVFTSSVIILLNSSQHLHQSLLASGAPNAFFALSDSTPSKVGHIHPTFSGGVLLDTLEVLKLVFQYHSI